MKLYFLRENFEKFVNVDKTVQTLACRFKQEINNLGMKIVTEMKQQWAPTNNIKYSNKERKKTKTKIKMKLNYTETKLSSNKTKSATDNLIKKVQGMKLQSLGIVDIFAKFLNFAHSLKSFSML